MNIRTSIIEKNQALCIKHIDKLTDWEQFFINSIAHTFALTQHQFNTLQEIAQKCKQFE
jgi:hypothetical protein